MCTRGGFQPAFPLTHMNRHKNTPEKPKPNLRKEKPMQTINNSNTNRRGIKPSLETSNLTFGSRVRHSSLLAIATLGLTLIFNLAIAHADPQVFEASGATPADIQTAVDAFRNFGDFGTNNGVGGTFPHGRREINWDAVPDARSAPNLFPANFFNSNSPRGAVFFTPGTGFQVSANLVNPTQTPVRFGNINRVYPALFSTFSPQRLFTALDSTITENLFFIPGTTRAATVKGFGAVFTDVNADDSTKIEYFDVNGNLLFSRDVLPAPNHRGGLSFLAVGFDTASVFMVRVTSGDRILKAPNFDVVVMDDFIYGEPQALQ